MGYFSNGTEGMIYERKYCERCVHGQHEMFGPAACPILHLHALYNYDQHDPGERGQVIKYILGQLIPTSKDGPWNDQCRMFKEGE